MIKLHIPYLLSTCIIGSIAPVQLAHAEYFRMPQSMFVIIGDPATGNTPGAGGSESENPGNGSGDNPEDNSGTPGYNGGNGSPGESNSGGGSGNSGNTPSEPESRISLTPADPFNLTIGTSSSIDFSNYLVATGLPYTATYRYQISGGTVPLGMSFNGSVLSGTPTQKYSTTSQISVYYIGSQSDNATQTYTFNVSAPALNVRKVGTGSSHTCIVTYENDLWCWGAAAPIGASAITRNPWDTGRKNILNISTGIGSFNCFSTTTNNNVQCIGGTGAHIGTKAVANSSKIVTGTSFACALTTDGAVKCWGTNINGQLGNGGTTSSSAPVTTIASGAIEVSAGVNHACAIMENGDIMCWGSNDTYQGGVTNYGSNNTKPTLVANIPGAKLLSSGNKSNCVVTSAGVASCWGYGALGGLGNGNTGNKSSPTQISTIRTAVVSIASGENHTCVTTADKRAYCWGYGADGQLANSSTISTTPISVGSGHTAYAGGRFSCSHDDAALKCWGLNTTGQIGIGSNSDYIRYLATVNIGL